MVQTSDTTVEYTGMENIYHALTRMLIDENMQTIAIQDDFHYWNSCGETYVPRLTVEWVVVCSVIHACGDPWHSV